MAHWTRKTVKGKKYVFVYIRQDGKQKQLPRKLYSYLDSQPEDQIRSKVAQLEAQYEGAKTTPDHILFSDDALNLRVGEWVEYLRLIKKRARGTREKYASLLRRFCLPYFLELGLKDPSQWPPVSIKFFDYLRSRKLTQPHIAEINNALRSFYRWLQEEQLVAWDGVLALRNTPKDDSVTPLAFTIAPPDVLAFVKGRTWEVQLLALAGYFLSLRPQETFALAAEDFGTGKAITELACVKANRATKLYHLLAVHVTRQQSNTGEIELPKAHSKGWVACFNKAAAEQLVALVNDRPDGQMLVAGNRQIYRRWRLATEGTPLAGVDLKDLRRASIYWLGHHSKLSPIQLMKHARHKEFETTQLYLRRPEEEAPKTRSRLKLGA